MTRLLRRLMAATMLISCVTAASASEVKMTGDARIHANWWSQRNYTGWTSSTAARTATYDSLTIYERFRLRSDFIAGDNLKFRLGVRANSTAWGSNGYTLDNSATTNLDVYQAFLQFKWPASDLEFTIGLQDLDLPISNEALFNSNPVLGGLRGAAAIAELPVNDHIRIVAGFSRFVDDNGIDATTTQQADELDGYFMVLPITLDGFIASPWGMVAVAGNNSNYTLAVNNGNAPLASNMLALGGSRNSRLRNTQDLYFWVGSAFAVTALDPFRFYADIAYGSGNGSEPARNRRSGLFFDVGAEYTGLDMLTPQISFWYSTGEDGSLSNGDERMPSVMGYWGPSNSFLFDSSQVYSSGGSCMNVDFIGSWGFVAALDKISIVQNLTHRIAFSYARGTSSSSAIRNGAAITAAGYYPAPVTFVQMGRDLTVNEYVMSVNFDHKYAIYKNLAAIVETGWAHGEFESSVWGRRLVNQAKNGDAWKVAFGLQYKF